MLSPEQWRSFFVINQLTHSQVRTFTIVHLAASTKARDEYLRSSPQWSLETLIANSSQILGAPFVAEELKRSAERDKVASTIDIEEEPEFLDLPTEPQPRLTKPYDRSFLTKGLPPPVQLPPPPEPESNRYSLVARSRLEKVHGAPVAKVSPVSQPLLPPEKEAVDIDPSDVRFDASDIELDIKPKKKPTVPPGAPPLENLDSSHLSDDKHPALKSWLIK
jgi:hypothetical protein